MTDKEMMQLQEKLDNADIILTEQEFQHLCDAPDILPAGEIPVGYKKCNKCGTIKKISLFNKNSAAKDGLTVQCKECQKATAKKSYGNHRHEKKYKQYYQQHKDERRAKSREYYQQNKEHLSQKHAAYRQTKAGKKAMNKAHKKRHKALGKHQGIPYTRELVIDRDRRGGTDPICYLCGNPITGALHLDHVIPVVCGGNDCFTNVACVHDTCNLRKSKDAREVTPEQVEGIVSLSETYMDNHQEDFPEIFGVVE